jgi:CubicO group peptidase (beta-lactamase class C family)
LVSSYCKFTTPTPKTNGSRSDAISRGYALEEITGQDYETLLQSTVLKPLGLNGTFYQAPKASLGIIPGNANATQWNFQLGDESPYVNLFITWALAVSIDRYF